MKIKLRSFQIEALEQYRQNWEKGSSHLGIAPTGFGKSIVSGYLASRFRDKGFLTIILAHRENIVTQNAQKVNMVDPTLRVGIEMSEQKCADISLIDVLSVSIASMKGKRLEKFASDLKADKRDIFLITDEAHHCLADSYLNFYETIKPTRHLGLTATPFRGDGENLRAVFEAVGFEIDKGLMVDERELSNPHHFRVDTYESLKGVKTAQGDYVASQLAEVLNVDQRNELILATANDAIGELIRSHGQTLAKGVCFAIDVDHALQLAKDFQADGWESYAIHAGTSIDDRRKADDALRYSKNHVMLTSCGVLTEGWDVEQVNLGLFTRPTKSLVLAEQMAGRVLRKLESKPTCLLIDFQDRASEGRVSIASTWGLPPQWDSMGQSLRADRLWFLEQLRGQTITVQSELWSACDRSHVMSILESPKSGRTLDRSYLWWVLNDEYRMALNSGSIVVYQSGHGDYIAEWRSGQEVTFIDSSRTLEGSLNSSEWWLDQYYPDDARFLSGREKFYPATDKQIAYLARNNIDVPKDATKHECSRLINELRLNMNKKAEGGYISFGKYKDYHISEVPYFYLTWLLNQEWVKGKPEYLMAKSEIERRAFSDF